MAAQYPFINWLFDCPDKVANASFSHETSPSISRHFSILQLSPAVDQLSKYTQDQLGYTHTLYISPTSCILGQGITLHRRLSPLG